jgi:gamma-glutamyltranspeptidase/glutathione hydrolase
MDRLTPTRHSSRGMVCSVDHLASSAGLAILRDGGSAVDAAVATSAVLAVTTPHMCGMGGDLFALVHDGSGPPAVLNASGRAGTGADPDRLRAEGHRTMPFVGDIRTVTVPGCVDGWLALHERFGRLPLSAVLAPAVRSALEGFPVSGLLAAMLPEVAGRTGTSDLAPGRRSLRNGDRCRRPGVARTLLAIADEGRGAFYQGEFGDGLLTLGHGEYRPEDLARNQADWVEPLGRRIWGADVWTTPPNSQGYLTLAAALLAEGLALPDDPDDPLWVHLLVESARQAGFDRLAVLHEQSPSGALLDPHELAARRRRIRPDWASRLTAPADGGGTIHLCVVDADRVGVSLIQSNASGFGSLLFEPRTGINLHNRGLGFSLVPGHPAEYGPGRRPPHTLSPALVTAPDGSLRAVLGSMGGDAQPQIVLQLLARLLHSGQEPAEVIQSPRFVLAPAGPDRGFDTWSRPDELCVEVEADCPAGWVSGLEERGHQVRRVRPANHDMGHAHLIEQAQGGLGGASDRRAVHGAVASY